MRRPTEILTRPWGDREVLYKFHRGMQDLARVDSLGNGIALHAANPTVGFLDGLKFG